MSATWWCVGGEGIWVWRYQPIIGVWLIAVAAVGGFARWHRRRGLRPTRRQWALLFAAVGTTVLITDWPIGPLAAGYLVSLGMLRFMVITLMIAPLLLLALPAQVLRRAVPHRARWLVSWPAGIALFNAVLFASHLPPVLDAVKVTQLGAFLMDVSWLLAGIAMWWPALDLLPERPGLGDPMRLLYLFVVSMPSLALVAFLVFARRPLYALYELAPPLTLAWTPVDDQVMAGVVMVVASTFVMWTGLGVMFVRWGAREAAK